MNTRILLIEDESGIRQLISFALSTAAYQFYEAKNLQTGRLSLQQQRPDLIILDWMLPDGSGISLLQELRKRSDTASIPVLMLTARSAEADIIKGLDSGADDYLTKPFSIAELKARINALLRRSQSTIHTHDILTHESITLNKTTREVSYAGKTVALHRREFDLLSVFMTYPGKVHSREALIENIWGEYADIGDRAVDVSIRRLRKAFSDVGHELPLTTLRGTGYRLDNYPQT